jgi:hypothetical protein
VKHSYALASSRFSIGLRKSGLDERQAAAVRIGSKQRKMAPKIIIYRTSHQRSESAGTQTGPTLASLTSTGSVALESMKPVQRDEYYYKHTIERPSAVIVSSSLIAPISFRKFQELDRAATFGGSIALPKNS